MFLWLGRLVTKYAPAIVIVILIISMLFGMTIPMLEFKTNLNSFLPDNELRDANKYINDNFGENYAVHLILVEADNAAMDVLTPDALREQYLIYEQCKNKANIAGVLSIAAVFDDVFSRLDPANYTTLDQLTDTQINDAKGLFFQILNGTMDISLLNFYLNLEPGLTTQDLEQMADLFFDKDFDYNSPDPKVRRTIIIIYFEADLSIEVLNQLSTNIVETVTVQDSSNSPITIKHTSASLINAELDQESRQSFITLAIAIIVLIVIVLFISFRRISYVIIPLITLILAVLWTFGTMILLNIEFTIITVAIIPLIIGLGVDYSVYISKRYQEELRNGRDISSAITRSVSSVGTAMFLAVFTTIIAFMSNLTSEILPIREFGLVCGLGIFYAFLLTLTFNTSMRWLLDTRSNKNPIIGKEKELYVVDIGTKTASYSVIYYPILVLILVVILTVGALNFGLQVRSEFNNSDFFPNDWESLKTQNILEDEFNGSSFTRSYILLKDPTGGSNLATVAMLWDLQLARENMYNDKYIVRVSGKQRVESIIDYVEQAIKSNYSLANIVDTDNDLLPDTDEDVITVFDYLFERSEEQNTQNNSSLEGILNSNTGIGSILYRDSDGNYRATVIKIYVNTKDSSDVRNMFSELENDIKDIKFKGLEKTITGNAILTVTTMDSLQESQIWSTAISIFFALVILIAIYRNAILGVIAIIPVLISSVWILGTMFIFGISINVFTVSITALTIGLGIDYAIHIIERYREERKKHNAEASINRTIRNTGAALFISGLTTVCGFIVLIISPIPPIQHFGIITSMTIVYSIILAVVVIPILLLRIDKK